MYANAGLVAVAFAENGSGNEKLYTPPDDHFHMRATEIFFAIQSFLTHHWAATFARSANADGANYGIVRKPLNRSRWPGIIECRSKLLSSLPPILHLLLEGSHKI